jgi:hypothetical protein
MKVLSEFSLPLLPNTLLLRPTCKRRNGSVLARLTTDLRIATGVDSHSHACAELIRSAALYDLSLGPIRILALAVV